MHEVAKSVIHSELISVLNFDFRGTHYPFCLVNKNEGDEKILASCQTHFWIAATLSENGIRLRADILLHLE